MDFEKLETDLNAHTIDLAKFGQPYLNNGRWFGVQVIPADWVAESTQVDPSTHKKTYYPEGFEQRIHKTGDGFIKFDVQKTWQMSGYMVGYLLQKW